MSGWSENIVIGNGFNAYIYGTWEGIILISISFIFFKFFKAKLAIILGIIGCLFIGFNLIYLSFLSLSPFDPHHYRLEIGFFLTFIIWILLCGITFTLTKFKFKKKEEDISMIKKTILNLGIKYDRLEVHEISEKCGVDKSTIIDVIQDMIKNHEIYAEYFKTSNTVAFNQQANIDEIDKLMESYKKWEEEKFEKND